MVDATKNFEVGLLIDNNTLLVNTKYDGKSDIVLAKVPHRPPPFASTLDCLTFFQSNIVIIDIEQAHPIVGVWLKTTNFAIESQDKIKAISGHDAFHPMGTLALKYDQLIIVFTTPLSEAGIGND